MKDLKNGCQSLASSILQVLLDEKIFIIVAHFDEPSALNENKEVRNLHYSARRITGPVKPGFGMHLII